ncbi:hypothetical protein H4582DRAFT_2062363 [Lactarius indigo]|nr:hypothetical protein H4582DRAFT_2062363 [Lactarius indigo]
MFSDPVDDSPSDTQSFDEDDMYGSDGDVETISLKPLLEHVSEEQETSSINQCVADVEHPLEEQESSLNDYEVDMDIISNSENIHRSVNDFSLMVRALCEAEGIEVSNISHGQKIACIMMMGWIMHRRCLRN